MRLIPLFFLAFAALLAQPTLPGPVTVRPPVDDSSAASIRLREKLANGTEYFEWKAPASLIANVTLIGPDVLPPSPKCLLIDAAGASSYVACSGATSAMIFASDYDFTPQTPGGSLTAATPASITLTPCPTGVSHDNTDHKVRVFGGTGTAEAVLITGGDCESGATTGTIEFTPANDHSGAWQVGSATAGGQEAVYVASPLGTVFFKGSTTIYATLTIRTTAAKTQHVSLKGIDRASSIIVADSTLTGPGIFVADYNDAAEKWTSAQYAISDLMFDFNAAPNSDTIQIGDGADIDVGNGPLIHNISIRGGKRCIYALTTGKLWLSNSLFDKLDAADDCIYLDVTASPLAMGGWTIHDVEIGTNETGGAGAGSGIHIVCTDATYCNWTNLDMVQILGKWKHSLFVEDTAVSAPTAGVGMYVTVNHLVTEAFTSSHTVKFLNSSFNHIGGVSWISNMNASGGNSALYVENGYEFIVNDTYLYSGTGDADVSLNGGARFLFSGNRFIGTTKAFAFDVTNDTTLSTVGFNHFAQIAHNQNAKWLDFVAPGSLNVRPLISPFRVLFETGSTNTIVLEAGDAGATNPKKPFYVDAAGTFRMMNDAYSANVLSVDNAGYGMFGTMHFADLGTMGNAWQTNCDDCKLTSAVDNTCATGGTGALAVRINSVWRCFDTPNVEGGGWTTLIFADTETEKLRFFASSATAHYGVSVASGDLRIYRDYDTSKISFGYGYAASFTPEVYIDQYTVNVGEHAIKGNGVVAIDDDLMPFYSATYDLGTSAGPMRWKKLWVGDIDANGAIITTSDMSGRDIVATRDLTATRYLYGCDTDTPPNCWQVFIQNALGPPDIFAADIFSSDVEIQNATRPKLVINDGSMADAARMFKAIGSQPRLDLSVNLMYNGSTWDLDNISNGGIILTMTPTLPFYLRTATAGANPRTLTTVMQIDAAGMITANLTGNVTGTADYATALATDPTACSTGEFVTDIAADGTLTCAYTAGIDATISCGAGTAVKTLTVVKGLITAAGCAAP